MKTLTISEYTALAIEHINPRLLKLERELMQAKWWDYRLIHPMQATYEFAEAYKQAKRDSVKRRFDIYKGLNTKGLKHDDFLKCSKSVITGLWKARQQADRLGIPYDFYCSRAIKYTEVHLWENLPQPCHLYSTKVPYEGGRSMLEDVGIKWLDRSQNQIITSDNPFFLTENHEAHPVQRAYILYLLESLSKRPSKPIALCTLVYELKQLPESVVRAYFKSDAEYLLKEAKSFDCHA